MSGCHNSTPGGPGKPASPVKSKKYDEITQQQTNKKNTTDHRITYEKSLKNIYNSDFVSQPLTPLSPKIIKININ